MTVSLLVGWRSMTKVGSSMASLREDIEQALLVASPGLDGEAGHRPKLQGLQMDVILVVRIVQHAVRSIHRPGDSADVASSSSSTSTVLLCN